MVASSHIHGASSHGEVYGLADFINSCPADCTTAVVAVDSMADLQSISRLIREPLPKTMATGLGKQVSALYDALWHRLTPLHLIVLKVESHIACAGNNLVDAYAGYIGDTTTPTYPIESHIGYTLPIHIPPLQPETNCVNLYEQPDEVAGDHPFVEKYHTRHYPQPITTISLRVSHSTAPKHTRTLAARLDRDRQLNRLTSNLPLHYPSYLNPGNIPPELQKHRWQGITNSIPLFPILREYHRHLHEKSPNYKNRYQIGESYDTCLCGQGIETVYHLLVCELGKGVWPQQHRQEGSVRPPREEFDITALLLRPLQRHLIPNPPSPNPLTVALQDASHISYLMQSLLPEPVWMALKATTFRPDRAAASLQKAGLRVLQTVLVARNLYFHQILDHNPTSTARVYRYLLRYKNSLTVLPTPISAARFDDIKPVIYKPQEPKKRKRLRR